MFYEPATAPPAPDAVTTEHILRMASRAQAFCDDHGPITMHSFTFGDPDPGAFMMGRQGGYTDTVDSGDGDFLTADTLWDFKVSRALPTKDHTLQLLMYFPMGKQSGQPEFARLTHVGISNPRFHISHQISVFDVSAEVIDIARRAVIGYAS